MNRSNYKNRKNPINQGGSQNMATKKLKLNLHSDYFERLELTQHNNHNYCVVPITLRHLSELVDELFKKFNVRRRSFQADLYTDENKQIYKKVCFFLAEMKLDSGTNAFSNRNADHLSTCKDFTYFSMHLPRKFPYPLALYFNSIGRFKNKSINYVPVPAITENHIVDACYSCMPCKFINVLNQLANGVETEKVPVTAQESLKSLPAIKWEKIKNETQIRLAPESVEFWLKPRADDTTEDQARELNITRNDFNTFDTINNSLMHYHGILTDCHMSNGEGNASQLVRFDKRSSRDYCHWYTMHGVPDDCKKLGIAFGFGHFEEPIQPSIAVGNILTAHTRGESDISEFMRVLLQPIIDIKVKYDYSSDSD